MGFEALSRGDVSKEEMVSYVEKINKAIPLGETVTQENAASDVEKLYVSLGIVTPKNTVAFVESKESALYELASVNNVIGDYVDIYIFSEPGVFEPNSPEFRKLWNTIKENRTENGNIALVSWVRNQYDYHEFNDPKKRKLKEDRVLYDLGGNSEYSLFDSKANPTEFLLEHFPELDMKIDKTNPRDEIIKNIKKMARYGDSENEALTDNE